MAFEIKTYPNDGALARDAAGSWLGQLEARSKAGAKEPYYVALSGGRIAKNFFSEIASQAANRAGLFSGVHFFWADERCVPPTDPESNYAIAKQLMFEPLKIPEGQIHRLKGEQNEALALSDAVGNIESAGKPTAGGKPIFDMIFLGMGEDGHVASLFPGEPENVIADKAIYRAVTAVKPPPRRITLGYSVIIGAAEAWVLISGADKEKALRESILPSGKTPLARVLRERKQTRILSDVQV